MLLIVLYFHRTPDLNYDHATNTGRLFNYFTYGVACTEVEIDCLTGDHQVGTTFQYVFHTMIRKREI